MAVNDFNTTIRKTQNARRTGVSLIGKPSGSSAPRVPPHSSEAEMSVLGSLMIEKNALARVIDVIDPDSFYSDKHKILFQSMMNLYNQNVPIDFITMRQELTKNGQLEFVGGLAYLTEVANFSPTAANIEHHARIIQEKFIKRALIETASGVIERCYDESADALEEIDSAESGIFSIAEKRFSKSSVSLKKLVHDTLKVIENRKNREGGLTGVSSGYQKLDEYLGGFQDSDLLILAGRPSMGKTALALSIARNMAMEFRYPIAFFSVEMAAIQLVIRLISAEAKINQHKIRTGRLSDEDMRQIVGALGHLANAPIFIDDSPMLTALELRAKARRLKAEYDIKAVIVDYLQIMKPPKAESREREISIISQSLKQIAKELDIPILALAQLNRSIESRADKRPMLSDLRESGSIEQDADVVMFVNRPEVNKIMEFDDKTSTEGKAEIIIGKQRNGPIGTVRLAYQKDYARFENLAYEYEEPPEFLEENIDEGEIISF